MLHLIGLYHYPGVSNTPWDPIPYVWVYLGGPFDNRDVANFALDLDRAIPTREIDHVTYRAVYRMIVGEARLSWYGLHAGLYVPGQAAFPTEGDE
jgi:hypothetical protein